MHMTNHEQAKKLYTNYHFEKLDDTCKHIFIKIIEFHNIDMCRHRHSLLCGVVVQNVETVDAKSALKRYNIGRNRGGGRVADAANKSGEICHTTMIILETCS